MQCTLVRISNVAFYMCMLLFVSSFFFFFARPRKTKQNQVLQQGPPHVLSECSTYAMSVEEIGQMWGPSHVGSSVPAIAGAGDIITAAGEPGESGTGGGVGGAGGGAELEVDPRMAVDPALSLLILRFATMIVQKVGTVLL